MSEHLEDSAHCSQAGVQARLRGLSAEEAETWRRWSRGVGWFYAVILLAFGGAIVMLSQRSDRADFAMRGASPAPVAASSAAATRSNLR